MSVSTAPAEPSFIDRCHDAVALLGRLAMCWIFLSSGFGKLTDVAGFSGVLAKRGVPVPSFMGWLGAIVEFGGGVLIILGIKIRYVAILMILFVIVATLIAHRYWEYTGPALNVNYLFLTKNVGVLGGLLYVFVFGAGRYSVDAKWATKR